MHHDSTCSPTRRPPRQLARCRRAARHKGAVRPGHLRAPKQLARQVLALVQVLVVALLKVTLVRPGSQICSRWSKMLMLPN